jgi:hypothetical protein
MATRRVVSPQSRDRYPYVTPVSLEQHGVLATLSRWRPRVQVPYEARPTSSVAEPQILSLEARVRSSRGLRPHSLWVKIPDFRPGVRSSNLRGAAALFAGLGLGCKPTACRFDSYQRHVPQALIVGAPV